MMEVIVMYTYNDMASIKANRPIQASIGCSCGAAGIIVTNMALATAMMSKICLLSNTIEMRCVCVVCNKQRYVTVPIRDWYDIIDEDDLRALYERCCDFLRFEKRCEHENDICLSASLHNDQWSHIYTKSPRVHLVYCARCRKRGPVQLPVGLSDYINEVMNREC